MFLVRFQLLGQSFNTLTTDDQISRRNRDNFATQIQMRLSQEPKRFSQFFVVFLKSTSNFEYFEESEESLS